MYIKYKELLSKYRIPNQMRKDFYFDSNIEKVFLSAKTISLGEGNKQINVNRRGSTFNNRYVSHCWNCSATIDEDRNKVCPKCGRFYVCNSCGKCKCDYGEFRKRVY